MKYKNYVHENFMSDDLRKEVEKLAKKVMRFSKRKGFARLSFSFLSKDVGGDYNGLDYLDICVNDVCDNRILNEAFWG